MVTRSVQFTMKQEPQKHALATTDAARPEPPASKESPADAPGANEPAQVIRPEDEALVAERLRELGYIE